MHDASGWDRLSGSHCKHGLAGSQVSRPGCRRATRCVNPKMPVSDLGGPGSDPSARQPQGSHGGVQPANHQAFAARVGGAGPAVKFKTGSGLPWGDAAAPLDNWGLKRSYPSRRPGP